MKKWFMGIMLAVMAVSLAACTPTTEKQTKGTTTAAAVEKESIPMSTGGVSDKVPDPNVKPVTVVSIYHGSDESEGIVQDMDALDVEGLDAQLLVDKLVEYGVLTKGTQVLDFTITGEEGNAAGILDLNQAISEEGCSDRMLLAEIGNTFIDNFALNSVKLKVNGGNYTGDEIQHTDSDVLEYESGDIS